MSQTTHALFAERHRPVLIALAFLALVFAGDRGLAALAQATFNYSSVPIAKLYSGRGEADVVILGNSRAYYHFFAEQWSAATGLDVRVYALPAGSMDLMEAFLADHVERYGSPAAVVIEPSNLIAGNEQMPNLKILSTVSPRVLGLLARNYQDDVIAGDLLHLYRFNSSSFLNLLHKSIVAFQQPVLHGVISQEKLRRVRANRSPERFAVERNNLESLRRTARFAAENGIALSVVLSPVLEAYVSNDGIARLRTPVETALRPGQRLYDYSRAVDSTGSYFDASHLNQAGVRRLFETMQRDGFFRYLEDAAATRRDG